MKSGKPRTKGAVPLTGGTAVVTDATGGWDTVVWAREWCGKRLELSNSPTPDTTAPTTSVRRITGCCNQGDEVEEGIRSNLVRNWGLKRDAPYNVSRASRDDS